MESQFSLEEVPHFSSNNASYNYTEYMTNFIANFWLEFLISAQFIDVFVDFAALRTQRLRA